MEQPEPTATSRNKQEQGRISEKLPEQAKTTSDIVGELLLTKYSCEHFLVTPFCKRF